MKSIYMPFEESTIYMEGSRKMFENILVFAFAFAIIILGITAWIQDRRYFKSLIVRYEYIKPQTFLRCKETTIESNNIPVSFASNVDWSKEKMFL